MTLLTQTAGPVALLFQPATAQYWNSAPTFTGGPLLPAAAVIFNQSAVYAAALDGTVERKRVYPQPPIFTYPVWQATAGWVVSMNLVVGYGQLFNPPVASKRVSGYFTDQNLSPIARTGFLYDRTTGAYLTTFTSSAVDGSWNGYVPTTNPVFAVLIPAGADSRNGVMMDNLTPV